MSIFTTIMVTLMLSVAATVIFIRTICRLSGETPTPPTNKTDKQ